MMNRRTFLSSLTALAPAFAATRPNVVMISVDDLNDWVGCLGYRNVQTPNIDALARRGVLFANAHCASPLCNPSRTAILTGQAAHKTGIYDNDQFWKPHLPGAVTLPMFLRAHGYTAAGAGKIFHHTSGMNPPDQWDDFQLQVFDDPWYRREEWYPWNKKIPAPAGHPFNGLKEFPGEFDWGVPPAAESEYGDMRAVEYGERFLSRAHAQPFFLAIGLWHPHIPMYSPQRFFDLYPRDGVRLPQVLENDLDDVPPIGREFAAFRRDEFDRIVREGKWRDAVQAYLAATTFADSMVGRLLKAVENSRGASNTIVIFWSDNGWHLGEKQHFHKSTLWQRSTHVPLIFAGPGMRQTGVARQQPVSLIDLYPTICDLCGLPVREELDGESLRPLLVDAKTKRKPALITFLPGNFAVRDERWRYIRYRDGAEELYDERKDPDDFHNLAADPRLASVKQRLARYIPDRSAPMAPGRDDFDFDFATHTYRRK
jgi:arylsulfatase A-like enzyme